MIEHNIMTTAALRAIPQMDTAELRAVLSASTLAMQRRMGRTHAFKVLSAVASEIRSDESACLSLQEIAFVVAQKHDLIAANLTAPDSELGSRAQIYSRPRQEAFWLAYQQMRGGKRIHSLPKIGKFFGGRDHTTVLHGVRQHTARLLAGAPA